VMLAMTKEPARAHCIAAIDAYAERYSRSDVRLSSHGERRQWRCLPCQ
jgi:hypothetical protein